MSFCNVHPECFVHCNGMHTKSRLRSAKPPFLALRERENSIVLAVSDTMEAVCQAIFSNVFHSEMVHCSRPFHRASKPQVRPYLALIPMSPKLSHVVQVQLSGSILQSRQQLICCVSVSARAAFRYCSHDASAVAYLEYHYLSATKALSCVAQTTKVERQCSLDPTHQSLVSQMGYISY